MTKPQRLPKIKLKRGKGETSIGMKDFLRESFRLKDRELAALMKAAEEHVYEKGELAAEMEVPQTQLPILVDGLFRGFLLDREGLDITDCFVYRRGDVVMGCNEMGAPSCISIEAVQPSRCLLLSISTVRELMRENPVLLEIYNQQLMAALGRHWEEKMLLHQCAAMERYQWFLARYPGLISTVNNKHIASFLGMTPVTLSRLRRQVREQGGGQE